MESEAKPNCIGTPISQVEIDIPLVRSLLEAQHPDLAYLPISRVDAGWDNTMFRLGDRLSIRLPSRQVAAALIEQEHTWLPHIASHLPLPVPIPYRIGKAGQGYPWNWSVLPWLASVTADQQEPDREQAKSWAIAFGVLGFLSVKVEQSHLLVSGLVTM